MTAFTALPRVLLAAAVLAQHASTFEGQSSNVRLQCRRLAADAHGGAAAFCLRQVSAQGEAIEDAGVAQAGKMASISAGFTRPSGSNSLLAHHLNAGGFRPIAWRPAGLVVRLRGGGKSKRKLGGKPLPGRGYMGNVIPRSGRDPIAHAEREMVARASKHRRKSNKKPKDPEGWFKKFVRQKQGLIDPKKGERPVIDTSKPKPRPSSLARHSYKEMFRIQPAPRPPKASVVKQMVAESAANAAGAGAASSAASSAQRGTAPPPPAAARLPTQQVLNAIVDKLKRWQASQATKYLEDTSIALHVRQTIRLVRAAKKGNEMPHHMREVQVCMYI